MSFNPEPTTQAKEIVSSDKRRRSKVHPPIYFNNIEVKWASDHKTLGLVKHINEKIKIALKGASIMKHLAPSKYIFGRIWIFVI